MTAYSDLQTRVADYLNRTDITTTELDMFNALAEARFNRRIIVPERETVATATASSETITLPTDFWGLRAIYADVSPKVLMKQMSVSELRNTYTTDTTGTPRHYAIENGALLLGPTPSSATDIEINYWATIPALTSSNTSNWLAASHPDIYLSAVLAEAFLLMLDEQRASLWDSRTEAKIEELNKAGHRKYTGAAPLAPKGPVNIPGVRA